MCTSVTEIKCPICNEYIDQSKNRIIVELCGHSKCRLCFITEENGCVVCNKDKLPAVQDISIGNEYSSKSDPTEDGQQQHENFKVESSKKDSDNVLHTDSNESSLTTNAKDLSKRVEVLEDVIIFPKTAESEPHQNKTFTTQVPPEEVQPSETEQPTTSPANSIQKAIRKPKTDERLRSQSHIEVINVDKKISYKCLICKKQFKSRNNKKYHLYCDRKLTRPLQCDKCDKTFITTFHMQYHLKTHQSTELFACSQCDRKYLREISLKKHIRKHKNELKFKCGQCDQKFVFREQLTAHENKHKNNKHKCKECDKSFWLKSNLTKHILIHSGERPFKCIDCDKSFNRSSALKTHSLIHTESRPFACTSCSKTFIDLRSLDRHSRTHIREGIFYECTHCSVKCSRRDNIRRHVRNIHSEENLAESLRTIFQNYVKNCNKTETAEILKPKETKVNNTTSVIKFVGKSTVDLEPLIEEDQEISVPRSEGNSCATSFTAKVAVDLGKPASTEENLVPEASTNVPDSVYKPLTVEAPPSWDNLQFQRQNCSNFKVYRQLLSPYLKPSAKWRAKSNMSDGQLDAGNSQHDGAIIMDDQMSISQNHDNSSVSLHCPSNDTINKSDAVDLNEKREASVSSVSQENFETKKKNYDQYAIYRKILRRSNE